MVEVRKPSPVHGWGKYMYISVVLLLTVLSSNVLAQSTTPSCNVRQPNTTEILCGEDFLIEWVDTNQNLSIVYGIFLNCSGINIVVNNYYPNTGELVKNTTYLLPCAIINNKSCLVLITSGTYSCSSDTFTFMTPSIPTTIPSISVPTFISVTLTPISTPTKPDQYIGLIITLVAMSMVFIIILVVFLVLSSCCKRKCTPVYRIFIKCVYCSKCIGCAAICNSKSDDQNKKSKIWNIEMED